MKRIGKKKSKVDYYKRPSTYVIIERDKDDKIAIATDNPNVFFFLGGGIEKDEITIEALKREVIEESGYSITKVEFFDKVSSYCYSETNGYMDIDATFYIAKFDQKIAEPKERDHKIIWVSPQEYQDKLFHKYQNYILSKFISCRNKRKKFIYSTTTRALGECKNIKNFTQGLRIIENSKFKNVNFNFCDMQEILDLDNYKDCFKEIVKHFNIVCNTAHAPFHYPFFFNDYYSLKTKEIYEERILKSIELSSILNVEWLNLHIGTSVDAKSNYDKKQSIKDNINYLRKFVECAVKHNVKLSIENGTNMYKEVTPTIDELIEIVDYYNRHYKKEVLGVCFDFGHANVGKLDIYEEIIKLDKRLKVTHIHDNYGKDDHNFPYNGTIDWSEKVSKALATIKYSGELTLEVRYNNNIFTEDILNDTYALLDKINFYH